MSRSSDMMHRNLHRVLALILLIATIGLFWQIQDHDFITLDDTVYVTDNRHVRPGLTKAGFAWAFSAFHAANWHPLTWLSHMLDCQLYGLNPAGHHLTNLFFHVANILLLFLVLREATGRLWESAVVAALFALHPLHVESVAWVSERKDVLSGFFFMLTLLAYLHYCQKPGGGRYLLILSSFALGLMAKPMLVTLPFVLLLIDYWPLGRFQPPSPLPSPPQKRGSIALRLVWEKIPLFALSAASSVITYIAQSKGGAVMPFELLSLKMRILNALVAYVRYLEKLFWPHDLSISYPHPGPSLPVWQGAAAGLFLIAVSLLLVRERQKRPFLLMGWLWFLGTLVPVIGIVQVGGHFMADRYTYLPSIGIFIMAAWAIPGLVSRLPYRRALLALGALIVLFCLSVSTWSYTGRWQDSEMLYRHAISLNRRNYFPHKYLGTALMNEDKLDEAIVEFKKALDINPSYQAAHNGLGIALSKKGLFEKAIDHFKEALRASPNHVRAHCYMAKALLELGHIDEAVYHLSEALCLDPNNEKVHIYMGIALARLNKMDEAVVHLTRAIDLCPYCPDAHNSLGRVLTLKGDLEGALKHLNQTIKLQPDNAQAYNNLGLVFTQLGELEEAIFFTAAAIRFKPDYTEARANFRHIISQLCVDLEEGRITNQE